VGKRIKRLSCRLRLCCKLSLTELLLTALLRGTGYTKLPLTEG
jgi:hypothetical protein